MRSIRGREIDLRTDLNVHGVRLRYYPLRLNNWINLDVQDPSQVVSEKTVQTVVLGANERMSPHTAVLDFRGVSSINQHCPQRIMAGWLRNGKCMLLLNCAKSIEAQFEAEKPTKVLPVNTHWCKKARALSYFHPGSSSLTRTVSALDYTQFENDLSLALLAEIRKHVKEHCFKPFNGVLKSTSIWSNYRYRTSPIIGSPYYFPLTILCMSRYVTGIEELLGREAVFVAASANGAVLTSGLASYMDRKLLNLNHLGPRGNLFERRVLEFIEKGMPYILIGDYILGGTELKLVQSQIESKGARLRGAVVIGITSNELKKELEAARKAKQHRRAPYHEREEAASEFVVKPLVVMTELRKLRMYIPGTSR